ncbi:MAG TPA: glycine/sarcosine/betaine reductase selenoprotein B family protein [Pyrinomonadaceae bacterium]|jgi:D-proline reductase (dithiol) PrdB
MKLIEKVGEFSGRFKNWNQNENLANYPFVENTHAPFTPLQRALPMLNLGLISSAGAYIDGTDPFDLDSKDGDLNFREFPIEVEAEDFLYAAKGYDAAAVREDRNVQIPIERLREYESNGVIGMLNSVWWSLSPWIPNAALVANELAPQIAERLAGYEIKAALLVPASRLCHQTLGIVARAIEARGIPTMLISVDRSVTDRVRPPRTAYYAGEFGMVAGKPNWKQYQLRVLDEAMRWIETFDQPASRKLAVELETETEKMRGEI